MKENGKCVNTKQIKLNGFSFAVFDLLKVLQYLTTISCSYK